MHLDVAKVLRIYRRSKQELEEALKPLVGEKLARTLSLASCREGMEILESELIPEGVVGSIAALESIKWEARIRPPIPSPVEDYIIALAVAKCASSKGIPVSVDELEKMAEESEVTL